VLPQFSYVRPDTLQDTVKHLNEKSAAIHARGTDLIGCLRDGIMQVDKMVSLSALSDLHGIRETADGGLIIGALTTITEVAENPRAETVLQPGVVITHVVLPAPAQNLRSSYRKVRA